MRWSHAICCLLGCLGAMLYALPFASASMDASVREAMQQPDSLSHGGYLDWTQRKAVAVGRGFPPETVQAPGRRRQLARRAAVLDARRNLLEVLQGVRIQSQTTVKDLAAQNDTVRQELRGMVQFSVVESTIDQPDGGAEARVSVSLDYLDIHALPPQTTNLTPPAATQSPDGAEPAPRNRLRRPVTRKFHEQQDAEPPAASQKRFGLKMHSHGQGTPQISPPVLLPRTPAPPRAALPQWDGATGVVVDARGTGFEPSLAPSLHDGRGELYPAEQLTPEVISRDGIVRYFRDMFTAMGSPAAGESPLVVNATGTLPGRPDALVIAPAEAPSVRALMNIPNTPLGTGKVVIVF